MLALSLIVPLVLPQTSARPWTETAIVRAQPAPAEAELFGSAVSYDDERLLVGAVGARDQGNYTGAAYVLRRSTHGWEQEARLVASDAAAFSSFGASVSLDGDRALIGTTDLGSPGHAYVFRRDGDAWLEERRFTGSNGFGASVALDGNTALVGSPYVAGPGFVTGAGSADFYEREGNAWKLVARVYSDRPLLHAQFGYSVALEGDFALIGARLEGNFSLQLGAAYLFARTDGTWKLVRRLVPSDPLRDKQFGWSVALANGVGVVGAPGDNQGATASGAAYVFERDAFGAWTETQKLKPTTVRAFARFGLVLDAAPGRIAIGTPLMAFAGYPEGAAYVFRATDTGWREEARVLATDPEDYDGFGYALALAGDELFVGTPYDDEPLDNAGYVSLFRAGARASTRTRTIAGNVDCYRASAPRLGAPWTAAVDLSQSPHVAAILVGYDAAATGTPGRAGTLLVGGNELFRTLLPAGTDYAQHLPDDPALAGFEVHTQAILLAPGVQATFTNAVDLVVGY